ncbi:MAG: cell division protein FtsZ [Candidatus Liptonbacteria bacterium RIFCSPLOWO2_01_FULL_53_13]|uniref:Cell division protein FtsZ n=1 Tax=Candidatus Liptonbacteria bacterium RIFCSPLOWO2_01_FULL_53_13 TaxID=1798651 RepID=A0A1G2CK95_9BACT|nr:MAG: cell division protein FtsZ [Candidatus Liptonbacteria bacterium RIFCSPLOWO2_01_FULL_53_13]
MKKPKRAKSTGGGADQMQSPIANIKVVGVGGGGGNAVSRMNHGGMRGVQFIAINTDHQDLDHCEVRHKLYIGRNLTRGLGTGMNPDLGRQAAEENRSEIAEAVKGADIVFVAAGLGGGTGSGASPIVAEAAKQSGALTLAFVTKPFSFEGNQRLRIAEEGLMKLKDKVDALIVVPNDRIFNIIEKDVPVMKAFEAIDGVLKNSIEGIVELIMSPGIINVDFADVRAIVQDAGSAIVGVGIASGPDRAVNAVQQALNSPLLEVNPEGARGVLLGISGSKDLKMSEINDAAKLVAQTVDPGAKIIFGAYYDRRLKPNQIKVTLVATGFNGSGGQANSLFGGYFEHKQGFFTGQKPTPLYEDGKVKPGEAGKERSKEDGAKLQASMEPAGAPGKQEKLKEEKKPDADAWDIPAFLRRKKK